MNDNTILYTAILIVISFIAYHYIVKSTNENDVDQNKLVIIKNDRYYKSLPTILPHRPYHRLHRFRRHHYHH
jgi:hypothetical protein